MENVSPAPIPPQQQPHVTVSTEPPKVTQTVDTTFVVATQKSKQTSDNTVAGNVSQPTLVAYSTVASTYTTDQTYTMNLYQQTVQPAGVATLTTNASFQASLSSTSLGSVPSFHLPAQFQNQSYLPPTQGYTHFPTPGVTLMPLLPLSLLSLPVLCTLPHQLVSVLYRTLQGMECHPKVDLPLHQCHSLPHPSLLYTADSCPPYPK